MRTTFDYSGTSVLVTGGSSGIGLSIARAFRRCGANVSITGTSQNKADYAQDFEGMRYHTLHLDNATSINDLIGRTDEVDVLINNAGAAVRAPDGLTPEGFQKNIDINLNSVFRLSQGFRARLAARPGCIINIASMFSYFGSPRIPGYGASKAGVVQLTKTLAAMYATDKIRVNAIAPGWIETKITAGVQSNESIARAIVDRTPMGRWGKPDEIAGTALYLASDELASFVTGATIPVDGGYSAS